MKQFKFECQKREKRKAIAREQKKELKQKHLYHKVAESLKKKPRTKNPEQLYYFKSIRLKVVSPYEIKLWAARNSLAINRFKPLPYHIQPHLTNVWQETSGLLSSWTVGPMYKDSQALWDPNNEGSVSARKWGFLTSQMKQWKRRVSLGRVEFARTLDYKTLKPERQGLFCERTFGPLKEKEKRRYQMGYIALELPCTHVWYLKARPNQLEILLNMKKKYVKMLTYYNGFGSIGMQYENRFLTLETEKQAEPLFRNRHRDMHYSHDKTFWLNHTLGLNALSHSLFDGFVLTWGLLTFFGLEKRKKNHPKKWLLLKKPVDGEKEDSGKRLIPWIDKRFAWLDPSTQETLGGFDSQDPAFWSKPWVSFCVVDPFWRCGNKPQKAWQQQVVFDDRHQMHKHLSLFEQRPQFFDARKQLSTFLLLGMVFNTLQSMLDVHVKQSAVVLISCPRKCQPFVQSEVHSNYSPAFKSFLNHVRLVETQKAFYGKVWKRLRDAQGEILHGYKSNWMSKKSDFPNQLSYKKEMTFSTFKQGLNDGSQMTQVTHDSQFFHFTRWIIYSQLIHWYGKPKVVDNVSSLFAKLNPDMFKKRMPSGFRWLATMTKNNLINSPLSSGDLRQQQEMAQKASKILPISLYTRMLEITPTGQVKHLFLLPFLDRYTHIQRYTIDPGWLPLLTHLRLSGPFHTQTQKKLNPLGTSAFRTFLHHFFQLSCKKHGLVSLAKKSKSILLSSSLQWDPIAQRRVSGVLSQLDYEKQKCVYHFLNQLVLTKHPILRPTVKQRGRVDAFVLKQQKMLGTIELKPGLFSASTTFFKRLMAQPFCYVLANASFQRRASLTLFNPFLLQDKAFFVRYLQTTRCNCYQNYYNFIASVYGFLSKPKPKPKTKPKKKKKFVWKKVTSKTKDIPVPFVFEPTASFFDQSNDRNVRFECLEIYLNKRKDMCRNTFGVVPTRFVWQTGRPILEEEWQDFLYYMANTRRFYKSDLIIPSYTEQTLLYGSNDDDKGYNTGGAMIDRLLRRYSQWDQVFTYSFPETELNQRRREQQESSLFSYDHELFFQERGLPRETQRGSLAIDYKTKYMPTGGVFAQWVHNDIRAADRMIYRFEQRLTSEHVKPLRLIKRNFSKWEIPVEERFKAVEELRPVPYKIAPYFNSVLLNVQRPFFQRKMYVALVKKRRRRFKMIRRLKTLLPFMQPPRLRPEWMMIQVLPVLPPDLRPILTFGNQIVVSDLTKLYQQIIYRNTRCLFEWTMTLQYSGRLLQEAVDALMENGKGNTPPVLSTSTDQPLKSLSDMLKGKKGRFRQNLLGKRVDYSGRSVIVVGPQLGISECGLPKEMALELFKPFLMRELVRRGFSKHAFAAKKLVDSKKPIVWNCLRQVMANRPVLLNRAPTLHRLGMQAFRPKLVTGRAILLHPLVCSSYNADFDGDQMAVHIPLTSQACAEAWKLLWSRNHFLSPATGEPTILPSQDMILGCYYLTSMDKIHRARQLQQSQDLRSTTLQVINGFPFQSIDQILHLVQMQILDYHSVVWLRWPSGFELEQKQQRCIEMQMDTSGHMIQIYRDYKVYDHVQFSQPIYFIKTTPGRALVNQSIWNALN